MFEQEKLTEKRYFHDHKLHYNRVRALAIKPQNYHLLHFACIVGYIKTQVASFQINLITCFLFLINY